MREHPYKRPTLADVNQSFQDKILLSVEDVKKLTGWSESTVRRRLKSHIKNGQILKAAFVDQMVMEYS